MNALWIPVGSGVAIILLSLGVLEVMSEGVRVDQSSTGARRFWETSAHFASAEKTARRVSGSERRLTPAGRLTIS